ncbi:MAG: DNA-processing protein DprA, partial [Candidatus Eremiobacteraeota bacterium]|nr:DNA-processing protein DprA [Candidatus Eremiobacteraeota bacterium]
MTRLYVRGVIPKGGIAIVGSRTPPPRAADFAYPLASRLNVPVISGLAPGIDASAH